MRYSETLIAWDPDSGGVAVGPLMSSDDPDWTRPYRATGGAAYTDRRDLTGDAAKLAVMTELWELVYDYGIHPAVAHRAFLHIEEYQNLVKERGFGPDKGEHGHDPSVGYGRAVAWPIPDIQERLIGRSVHVRPVPKP